ncbi:MAG: RNA-directed polymerase [Parcubacteria group bacterium]|nr:RNA-directed polymerase [Parcubacteria group bacterium]
MVRIFLDNVYERIISINQLLDAWQEFLRGKRSRKDVQEFGRDLMGNMLRLHAELEAGTYHHGGYEAFRINDPKPRDIHKAPVRDRLLHHAVYRQLYPFFDRTFIPDSYSCRVNKGTHKAIERFKVMVGKVSKNDTRTCWVLKCDIRKFFASIDHEIMIRILEGRIKEERTLLLLKSVIESFSSTGPGKGLPLGNLTSQLLVNIYMNEFDQFAKHRLKATYYIRYADDFVILSEDRTWLMSLVPRIAEFLKNELKLTLHPKKVSLATFASGIDFLGWVHFPDHRVIRTATKKRMLRRLQESPDNDSVHASYIGMLSHGNAHKLRDESGLSAYQPHNTT